MQLNSLFGFLGRHLLQGDDPAPTDQGRMDNGAFASLLGVARNILHSTRSADPVDSSPSAEVSGPQRGDESAMDIGRLVHPGTTLVNSSGIALPAIGQDDGTPAGLDSEAPPGDLDPAQSDGSGPEAAEALRGSGSGGAILSTAGGAPIETGVTATELDLDRAITEGRVDDAASGGRPNDTKTDAGATAAGSLLDPSMEAEPRQSGRTNGRQGGLPGTQALPLVATKQSAQSGPSQAGQGAEQTISHSGEADTSGPESRVESESAGLSDDPKSATRSTSITGPSRRSTMLANSSHLSGDRPFDARTGVSQAAQILASDASSPDSNRSDQTKASQNLEKAGILPHGASPEVRAPAGTGRFRAGRIEHTGSGQPSDAQLQDGSQGLGATAMDDPAAYHELVQVARQTQDTAQTIAPATHPESQSDRTGQSDRRLEGESDALLGLDTASKSEGASELKETIASEPAPDPAAAVKSEASPDSVADDGSENATDSEAAPDPAAQDGGLDVVRDGADSGAFFDDTRSSHRTRSSESGQADADTAAADQATASGSDSEATGGSADSSDQTDFGRTDADSPTRDEVIDPAVDPGATEAASIDLTKEDRAAAEISFSPERTTITGTRGLDGSHRMFASRHAGAPWFQPTLLQSLRAMPLQAGWKMLELQLDEGHGTMTVRARRDEEKVSVAVSFSDPNLRSLAEANAHRLQQILQSEYESPVDFSLLSDGAGGSPQQDPGASSGGSERVQEDMGVGNSTGRRVQGAARPLVAGARNEWIG